MTAATLPMVLEFTGKLVISTQDANEKNQYVHGASATLSGYYTGTGTNLRTLLAQSPIVFDTNPLSFCVVGDWFSDCTDSSTIRQFCQRTGITSVVRTAISLAKKSFKSIISIELLLSEDPEGGEETLVIEVNVACNAEDAHRGYDSFVSSWVKMTDWESRKQICLSYNIG